MIDKREAQLKRESVKTVTILIIGIGIAMFCILYAYSFYIEKESQFIVKPVPVKPVINMTGLSVVYKVSKDYRKYFVAHNQYFSNKGYTFKIDEINFAQFMRIKENDTMVIIQEHGKTVIR